MQYGIDIFPYERVKKINKDSNKKKELGLKTIAKLLIYLLSGFFISRVMMINLMAPFGIAFLVTTIVDKDNKIKFFSALGSLLGYISLYTGIKNIWIYFLLIPTIFILSMVFDKCRNKKKLWIIYISIFLELALFNGLHLHISPIIAMLNAILQVCCIFSIYYIINYSIKCMKQIKTKYLFNSEEIISMSITLSLIISGTWGLNIFGMSIRNVVALISVVIIGHVKGSSAGGACGIAMGAIIGISTNNMPMFIGVFGICGLISGIFKESGKYLSGIAYMITFCILKLYSDLGIQFQLTEAASALAIYLLVPSKIYKKLELELDWQMKNENIKADYVGKIKEIVDDKLQDFSNLLTYTSETLRQLADNDKLQMKEKSNSIVQNLADRVCGNCNMKSICWKRESYYTYTAFVELINNYQNRRNKIPEEIERKCIKRSALARNAEEIIKNYIIDEMWKKRLSECRQFLADQINNISYSVEELTKGIDTNIQFNRYIENDIRRLLHKNNIKYRDIFCYTNDAGRIIVKLYMEACGGKQKCVKNVLPLVNKVTNKVMCVSDEGCDINLDNNECTLVLEETPKYHVASYVGKICKDGESYNGDSFLFDKLNDGTYMTIISDGMGSGPEAGQESTASVNIIEKFTKAGFSKLTAINMVNSLMSIKFSENEKFSTVDLSSIDLYTGEVDFMKVGAAASFIKSHNDVDVITSKSLPMGILDKVDIDISERTVENGDIIVMLSDGILDYSNDEAGKVDWLVNYLKETQSNTPEDICNEIVEKARELNKGKIKDDMTVIVSRVYSLY